MVWKPARKLLSWLTLLSGGFCREEETHPDAANFIPEEWLESDGRVPNSHSHHILPSSITLYSAGVDECVWGRAWLRILCLWLAVSWPGASTSQNAGDELERQIDIPSNEYNSYLIIKQNPFTFNLKPRLEKHCRQILEIWKGLRKLMSLLKPKACFGAPRRRFVGKWWWPMASCGGLWWLRHNYIVSVQHVLSNLWRSSKLPGLLQGDAYILSD